MKDKDARYKQDKQRQKDKDKADDEPFENKKIKKKIKIKIRKWQNEEIAYAMTTEEISSIWQVISTECKTLHCSKNAECKDHLYFPFSTERNGTRRILNSWERSA
uniref:Uncharacterized protein n=1 Tax=Romanomermis culicivorax TaxID=13658 RepID=A0A915JG64_ROMCU